MPPDIDQQGVPPELQNLVPSLNEKELKDLAERCIAEYEDDETSRGPWLDMHAKWIRLFHQNDKPVNPPWENSSQECIPTLSEACTQFNARAFQAFFPNRTPFKAIPTGEIGEYDIKRAERVSKHLSHQLLVEDPSYKRQKDKLLLSVPLHGSFFTKTYYDPVRGKIQVRNVRAEDLVLPYGIGNRELHELDRKSEIIWLSVNDTKIYASTGYFSEPCRPWTMADDKPTTTAIDQASGQVPQSSSDYVTYCKILEQHRLVDLDGDGIEEPYIVTIDLEAREIRRIAIRYETDQTGSPLYDKEPIEQYTDYGYLPNPDGPYMLGLGHLLGHINTSLNKLLRQTIDAGSLANMKAGFFDKRLATKKGELQFSMGKFIGVEPGTAGKIADSIHEFQFSGPDPTIANVLQILMQRSDRLAFTTEAVTGQTDKVQQPTAILALLDQSLQVTTAAYERLFDSWERELAKVYRLNGRYLDDKQYVTVLDADGLERFEIGRKDYANDLKIVPIVDTKLATEQQKLARAQAEWQFVSTNPLIIQSPKHLRAASKRYLQALGSMNIKEILPDIPEPGRVDDPQIENIGLLMPNAIMPAVHSEQDHINHLLVHDAMEKDPLYGPRLSPIARAQLEQHRQMHIAYMYGMTETALPGILHGSAGLGPINPVAAPPHNPMVSGGVPGQVPDNGGGPAGSPVMGGGQPTQGAGGGPQMDEGYA
jgi:hypothetical protein